MKIVRAVRRNWTKEAYAQFDKLAYYADQLEAAETVGQAKYRKRKCLETLDELYFGHWIFSTQWHESAREIEMRYYSVLHTLA